MNLRKLLKVCSLLEIVVGLSLMLYPSKLVYLLFEIEDADIVNILGRFAGVALLCLGIACIPGKDDGENKNIVSAVRAMFVYNSLVAVYFIYLKTAVGVGGLLLLPVAILHFVIAACFVYLILRKDGNLNN